uniref:Uncharacterized protein n=1 Tax=Paracoccus aminophilus JCM 7686 TaxID=1367847 RepID=C9DQ16_PARAH|nr:hypothetical protein [Paracoccus aminophilus JCM 7686]
MPLLPKMRSRRLTAPGTTRAISSGSTESPARSAPKASAISVTIRSTCCWPGIALPSPIAKWADLLAKTATASQPPSCSALTA